MKKKLTVFEDDKILLDLFRSGDRNALNTLFKKYYKDLKSYAFFIIRDYSCAEDVTQNSMLRATMALDSGTYNESSKFKAWIFTINHHECINWLRNKEKYKVIPLIQISSNWQEHSIVEFVKELSIENNFLRKEKKLYINQLLSRLTSEQKEILKLRYFNDLSFKEIGEYLNDNFAPSTHRGKVANALKELRKIIGVTKKRKVA